MQESSAHVKSHMRSRHTYMNEYLSETYVCHDSFMCVMTHSYVCHDSFVCVSRLIHVCVATHSYVCHDSFKCVSRLIHMCVVTTGRYRRPYRRPSVSLWSHMCVMTHLYVCRDSWKIHKAFCIFGKYRRLSVYRNTEGFLYLPGVTTHV